MERDLRRPPHARREGIPLPLGAARGRARTGGPDGAHHGSDRPRRGLGLDALGQHHSPGGDGDDSGDAADGVNGRRLAGRDEEHEESWTRIYAD